MTNTTWPQPNMVLGGRFRFEKPIKKGGNGEVWQAMNLDLGVRVAIKIPNLHKSSPLDIERFRREARALCLLHNENLLRFFEFSTEPTPYLVMELLRGHDLAELIEKHGPFSLTEAKALCRQICAGLQVIHSAGIVHRDIKPSNIFCVEKTGKLKIIDFGLMKLIHEPDDPSNEDSWDTMKELTEVGTLLGTPSFMSPEQWLEQAIVFQSDLWSVAVILYRLLTGQMPFRAKTQYALMRMVLNEQATPVSKLRTDLPPEVDTFFHRALHKNSSRRFSSASELMEAFEALPNTSSCRDPHLTPLPRSQHTPDTDQEQYSSAKTTRPIPRKKKSGIQRLIAGGIVFLISAAAVGFTWSANTRKSDPFIIAFAKLNHLKPAQSTAKTPRSFTCQDSICSDGVQMITEGLKNGAVLAVDPAENGHVYCSQPSLHTVKAIPKKGGAPIIVWNQGEVTHISITESFVFWMELNTGNIIKFSKTTMKPSYVVEFNCNRECSPAGLAGAGETLFWTWLDVESADKPLNILRNKREQPLLYIGESMHIERHALAADSRYVYWGGSDETGNAIWQLDHTDQSPPLSLTTTAGKIDHLVLDSSREFAYWIERNRPGDVPSRTHVQRIHLHTLNAKPQTLFSSPLPLSSLQVMKGYVYWSSPDGHIYRVSTMGDDSAVSIVRDGSSQLEFALDEQTIYWINTAEGILRKVDI